MVPSTGNGFKVEGGRVRSTTTSNVIMPPRFTVTSEVGRAVKDFREN